MNAKVVAIISGVLWTLIPAFILQGTISGRFTYLRWWACLAGPAIGLAVYYTSRWSYKKTHGVRILWAIVSLYLASGIYGVALVAMDLFRTFRSPEEIVQGLFMMPLAIWAVLTCNPVLWPLFALCFINHWLAARNEKRA
jgi:hypothetical protein